MREAGRAVVNKRVTRRAALTLALVTLTMPTLAEACSTSWARGWSPREIKRRADVRMVKGTWHMEALEGRRETDAEGQEWVIDGRFIGRIETPRGWAWATWHEAPDEITTCFATMYFKPTGDAKGTFWIARSKVEGRYRILLWEGEYLPQSAPEAPPQIR